MRPPEHIEKLERITEKYGAEIQGVYAAWADARWKCLHDLGPIYPVGQIVESTSYPDCYRVLASRLMEKSTVCQWMYLVERRLSNGCWVESWQNEEDIIPSNRKIPTRNPLVHQTDQKAAIRQALLSS